jgi:hypothetical protein
MTHWYESMVDRQIREAQERGAFENLPGSGKPIAGLTETYDEEWWLKDLVRRERITGALPATLLLRKEVEEVAGTVAAKNSELGVRRLVRDLNDRIHQATRGHLDGPPVVLRPLDEDEVVRDWRRRKGLAD